MPTYPRDVRPNPHLKALTELISKPLLGGNGSNAGGEGEDDGDGATRSGDDKESFA